MTAFTESVIENIQAESAEIIDLPGALLSSLDRLPPVIEAGELAELPPHNKEEMLIVDVRTIEQCVDGHIPGAIMLDYSNLVLQDGSAIGQLPEAEHLSRVLSNIGLRQNHHVIAYNDDNGSHAARLLWTLDVIGHRNYSLLNGGFAAWDELDLPIAETPAVPVRSEYHAVIEKDGVADFDYVLSTLGTSDTILLDTRTPDEFNGKDIRAERGGHIPGAINLDWSLAIDLIDNGRIRHDSELITLLHESGVTPDKQIIPYCHSHQRSAHTWLVLKHLGFPRVRAYAGSWSEWGNRADAPVEVGSGADSRPMLSIEIWRLCCNAVVSERPEAV